MNKRGSRLGSGKKRFTKKYSYPTAYAVGRSPRSKKFTEEIDIARFIQKSSGVDEAKEIPIKHSFDDFPLRDEIQVNLRKRGYVIPTPVQDQSINPILNGRDLLGIANTGTGKTGAFLLPLVDKISKDREQKLLIIAPTRELASQIEEELRHFSHGMKISYTCCVGGMPIHAQISSLRRNPRIVIGTPGRLRDLNDRRELRFDCFNNIVIDEIDRMLDMGFVNEITAILNSLPGQRQSLFFSATVPPKIRNLVNGFLKDPVCVEARVGETASVEQDIVTVAHRSMKFAKLQELLSSDDLKKVLIFNDTKHGVEKLTVNLVRKGFKAESIHGDKRQHQRLRSLKLFKDNAVDILVATDVAARGLDIKDVTHVINYTVPNTYDDYIHRIGRTGRAGNKGVALTFVEDAPSGI